jgi:hypothetical protein
VTQPRFIPSSPHPYKSVYNGTGSDIAANLVVMKDASVASGVKLPAAADSAIEGVTLRAIPTGTWGDIVVAGGSTVPLTYGGAITRGLRLMPTTAGKVVELSAAAGANVSLVGTADEDGSSDDVREVTFSGPNISRQG